MSFISLKVKIRTKIWPAQNLVSTGGPVLIPLAGSQRPAGDDAERQHEHQQHGAGNHRHQRLDDELGVMRRHRGRCALPWRRRTWCRSWCDSARRCCATPRPRRECCAAASCGRWGTGAGTSAARTRGRQVCWPTPSDRRTTPAQVWLTSIIRPHWPPSRHGTSDAEIRLRITISHGYHTVSHNYRTPSAKWQNDGKRGPIFVFFPLLNSERICGGMWI